MTSTTGENVHLLPLTPLLGRVDFGQGVTNAFANVAAFVPKLIGFLLILVIGYFVCKAIAKILDKALERVGFDKAVERGGVAKAMATSKYDPTDLLAKVVFYALFLFVLQAAFGVFGTNPVSDLLRSVIAYLPKVIAAILIVVVAAAIAAAVREIIDAALGGLSYGKALANGAAVAILVIAGFAVLSQLGIAPAIVNAAFYGLIATVVGVTVVAVGGSGIAALGPYWQRSLQRLEDEGGNAKEAADGAGDRIQARARRRAAQVSDGAGS